ncbi:unnamed protein product [Cuscuta epithymum]|nr:unnamed protein product [Cuscuta epithymum]
MDSKIADFGTAKIFGVDQTQGNTRRVVGTYGYMPPEYVMHGQFSVKTDVYSFGVLILEIITGKKISNFTDTTSDAQYLLSYVWKHWKDGRPLEILDPFLGDTHSRNEVIQCIHLGLLCVQEDIDKRPTMANIVLMLSSYSVSRPVPCHPGFCSSDRSETRRDSLPLSVNEVSTSEFYPR